MSVSDWQVVLDDLTDFDPDELREFLAADMVADPADPEFRERLRRMLHKLVRERYGDGSDSGA
jgi:hypothetical protein